MKMNYLTNIYMGQTLNTEANLNWYKMGRFGQLIHDDLNTVRTPRSTRQPIHQVHCDPFPLLLMMGIL